MILYLLKQLNKKRKVHIALLFLFVFVGSLRNSYGWDNKKTHPALTHNALGISIADSYIKSQIGLADGMSTELYWDFPADIKERLDWGKMKPDKTTRSILDWIKAGSAIEDEDGQWKPIRPRHHFHDPIRDFGLENQTDHPNWENYACTWTGLDLTGESALHWAAVGTAWQEPITNDHYWGKAREEFYKALTENGESIREESLAKAFLNLGHILHLIEDVGVPAHSRNDFIEAHYRGIKSPLNFKDNPLENGLKDRLKTITTRVPGRAQDLLFLIN